MAYKALYRNPEWITGLGVGIHLLIHLCIACFLGNMVV